MMASSCQTAALIQLFVLAHNTPLIRSTENPGDLRVEARGRNSRLVPLIREGLTDLGPVLFSQGLHQDCSGPRRRSALGWRREPDSGSRIQLPVSSINRRDRATARGSAKCSPRGGGRRAEKACLDKQENLAKVHKCTSGKKWSFLKRLKQTTKSWTWLVSAISRRDCLPISSLLSRKSQSMRLVCGCSDLRSQH
jgi:hypothetical protein